MLQLKQEQTSILSIAVLDHKHNLAPHPGLDPHVAQIANPPWVSVSSVVGWSNNSYEESTQDGCLIKAIPLSIWRKMAAIEGERLLSTWGCWPLSRRSPSEPSLQLYHLWCWSSGIVSQVSLWLSEVARTVLLSQLHPQIPWALSCPHALFLGPPWGDTSTHLTAQLPGAASKPDLRRSPSFSGPPSQHH